MTIMSVVVEQVDAASDAVLMAVNALIPELSAKAAPVSQIELEEMLASDAVRLLFARDDSGNVVGMLTLVLFRIPTGMRAWIEDVVVADEVRGQGVGELLTRAAIETAAKYDTRTVDLTSRPSRETANRLYQRVGFKLRETNVYRYSEE